MRFGSANNATTVLILLGFLMLGSALLPFAHAQPTVTATVNVGVSPYGVAYDPGKSEVFVVNDMSSTVSVISDTTNTVVANITVGSTPADIAYDSAKGEMFVSNTAVGTVSVISDSTNKVVANVTVGFDPRGVA
jgi:YVTN family beta-propeller protein